MRVEEAWAAPTPPSKACRLQCSSMTAENAGMQPPEGRRGAARESGTGENWRVLRRKRGCPGVLRAMVTGALPTWPIVAAGFWSTLARGHRHTVGGRRACLLAVLRLALSRESERLGQWAAEARCVPRVRFDGESRLCVRASRCTRKDGQTRNRRATDAAVPARQCLRRRHHPGRVGSQLICTRTWLRRPPGTASDARHSRALSDKTRADASRSRQRRVCVE